MFIIDIEEIRPEEESEQENRFADSVDSYAVKDLKNMEKTRKRSQAVSRLIRSLLIALCIGMMGYSVYMIGNKMIEDQEAEEVYDALRVDEEDYLSIKHGTNLPEPGGDGWYYYGGNTIVLKEGYEFTFLEQKNSTIPHVYTDMLYQLCQ